MNNLQRSVIWILGVTIGGFLFGFSVSEAFSAPPERAWVAIYNGPAKGEDRAHALALDEAGNVCVTGFSAGEDGTDWDYVTIKYSPAGRKLWTARYDGPGNGEGYPLDVAVDTVGNVYVTGYLAGAGTQSDWVTIKYDTDGNELWVTPHNGPANGFDAAMALGLDPGGNVYVTGMTEGNGTGRDAVTIKYDPDGSELWVARYNGPGNGTDSNRALVVDASGAVHVTGTSVGDGTGFDAVTIKYDADGSELWVARYIGPGDSDEKGRDVTLDGQGNVCVTGSGYPEHDFLTIKYDPDGNELWTARYNGPGNDFDRADSMVLDTSGNIYVTGPVICGYQNDMATVKYDTEGNQQWATLYNDPSNSDDHPTKVTVDQEDNVYVTGYSISPGPIFNYSCVTFKYDEDGNQLWMTKYDSVLDEFPVDMVVDDVGNVYITGSANGKESLGLKYDWLTIKYGLGSEWGAASTVAGNPPDSSRMRRSTILNYLAIVFFVSLVILYIRKVATWS